MPVTLPPPLWVSSVIRLLAADENQILERLFQRDEALLQGLQTIAATREDLFQQFNRLDDVERRWQELNRLINQIVSTFYVDLNEDGVTDWFGDVEYFRKLIADLKNALTFVGELTSQIIRFRDIQELLNPEITRLNQIEDLDRLIRYKLAYIYGRWDIDPQDDILSVGGTLPLAAWDSSLDVYTVEISTTPGTSPGVTSNVQSAGAFNGALAGVGNAPGATPYIQVNLGSPVFGATYQVNVGQAFIDTPSLTKVLVFRLGWDVAPPSPGDIFTLTLTAPAQTITVSGLLLPVIGPVDPILSASGRAVSFRIHGVDKTIEQL